MKKQKDTVDCRKYNKILNWRTDKVGQAQKMNTEKKITYLAQE